MGEAERRNARPSEVPEEKEEEKKMTSDTMTTTEGTQEEPVKYCTNLRASVETDINENPRAFVHSREWKKIMNGDPVDKGSGRVKPCASTATTSHGDHTVILNSQL